ncbi:MAG: rubrerythrin family protein [Bacillota bacterium]|uniref:Rubrerythrin family protein n=1 Tax=Thermanaerosceptrum fracticalcis TaxID=1712410 RepID=A0A7G6E693_THEFR|nr:rubrerythrin family protein [Thermanaerosceptrum fracticalcis]QNB47597.1 rubrerythrin family protein [Thermanaerosceptrum fracticalcis]
MSSEKNLKAAFAGESQANRKYLAFAQKAEEEGHKSIAKLFRATAEAETLHALSHLKVLGEIKSTKENLEAAKAGETYEFEVMYPEFLEEAKKEGHQAAIRTFHLANEAEKVHAKLYDKALQELDKGIEHDYYLCPVCGNIEEDEAPEKCSICGVPASKFIKY